MNARKDRRARVWRMSVAGMSGHAIARELGISHTQVRRDIARMASEIDVNVGQMQRLYSAKLEAVILESNQSIVALRDAARSTKPDVAASRAIALHNRTIALSVSELARINGARVEKVRHEHVGAGGGPITFSMDDVGAALAAAKANVEQPVADVGLH